MTFELHPEATQEYLSAIVWDEEQVVGLGAEFSEENEKAFDRISTNPGQYRFADHTFRVISTERFPYSIFYLWDPGQSYILIATVFHQKRDPASWSNRFFP